MNGTKIKQNGKYFCGAFFLYGGAALAVKFVFLGNVQCLGFLPVILGLFGGSAAACGVAAGAVLQEWCAESVLYVIVTSAIAIFFQAYIPYKLWYTFYPGACADAFLWNGKSMLKYLYIVILTTLTTGAMFSMSMESVRMMPMGAFYFYFVWRTADAAIFFGLPLLILVSGRRVCPCAPVGMKAAQRAAQYDICLYVVAAAGALGAALSAYQDVKITPYFAFGCWVAMFLLLALFMQKPIGILPRPSLVLYQAIRWKRALYSGVVLFGGVIMLLFFAFSVAVAYRGAAQPAFLAALDVWYQFLPELFVAGHLIFIAMLFFLLYLERKIGRFDRQAASEETESAVDVPNVPPVEAPAPTFSAQRATEAEPASRDLQSQRALDIVYRKEAKLKERGKTETTAELQKENMDQKNT